MPTLDERGRYVYANQPALDKVGTAFAYIRDANQPSPQALGTAFASDTLQDGRNREGFNLGAGGQISVVTNNRFDPSHPSFTSSDDGASYDTLTRFRLRIGGTILTPSLMLFPSIFPKMMTSWFKSIVMALIQIAKFM